MALSLEILGRIQSLFLPASDDGCPGILGSWYNLCHICTSPSPSPLCVTYKKHLSLDLGLIQIIQTTICWSNCHMCKHGIDDTMNCDSRLNCQQGDAHRAPGEACNAAEFFFCPKWQPANRIHCSITLTRREPSENQRHFINTRVRGVSSPPTWNSQHYVSMRALSLKSDACSPGNVSPGYCVRFFQGVKANTVQLSPPWQGL